MKVFAKLVSGFQSLFSKKVLIIDVSKDSKYTSDYDQRSIEPKLFALSIARKIPSADQLHVNIQICNTHKWENLYFENNDT